MGGHIQSTKIKKNIYTHETKLTEVIFLPMTTKQNKCRKEKKSPSVYLTPNLYPLHYKNKFKGISEHLFQKTHNLNN